MSRFDPDNYEALFAAKADRVEAMYRPFAAPAAERIPSPPTGYRLRAEFRLWHEGDDLFYAMFPPADPKTPRRVDRFPIASERIQEAMPALLEAVSGNPTLRGKLFQVKFLSTLSGRMLISLIYHRPLDETWKREAGPLERLLDAHIVGRSRGQKVTLSRDYVEEVLDIGGREFRYRQYEQGFTQPNGSVNRRMIEWVCERAGTLGGDLLELYCGNGNFSLPLAARFDAVLATDAAKSSMNAARYNRAANDIANLAFVRLSAEEVGAALSGERKFRRLQALDKPLADYDFGTILVDPPRAGLDPATTELAARFENILYLSCNPSTQVANLEQMARTHEVRALALFDQFPYTDHMECGVFVRRGYRTS